ncbi:TETRATRICOPEPTIDE-LIKE HELICAL DOMAIN-CONTAINING PROTEIN-RELATED [Salix purpurea]|uniref:TETRATRICOPEPTIDE-LIKE HELICAL DOMAIN-CONTAINING PROTEIN-RELATED n=1 Tax=Salix purpurea TaxID=77065 RepID=A0A9Q1ADB5_SALPP|nr:TETRATRICOPEPTIDE-LIKE HELICAL DOMAIN-CONTAINING PROTEIN-RELATED [Salix purpurea]
MEANKESGKNIFKETGTHFYHHHILMMGTDDTIYVRDHAFFSPEATGSIFSAEHKRRASRDNSLHEMGGQCAPFRTQVMSSSKLLTHFICNSRSFSTASFASMSSTSTTTPAITHTDPAKNDDQQQPLQSHKIVDTLYNLKNQPHLAFSIFSHLKHPDIPAYAAIIRILCHWGLHKMLHSIFLHLHHNNNDFSFDISHLLDMLSLPHHIDIDLEKEDTVKHRSSFLIQVYDALVKSYVTAGMLDEAINALFQFKRRGFLPRIFTFNYLMNKLIENGKVDAALAIYKQLKSLGLSPNDYTYSIIIKAFCRKGSLVEASNVFQEMELCGVIPNAYAYTTFIEGLCANQRSDLGYQVLQAWKEGNIPIDMYAYVAVIRGFCNEMKMDRAEVVLGDMEKQELISDARCYSELIRGYCKVGDLSKALALHNDMESKGIKTNCVIVSTILQYFCEKGMLSQAVEGFKRFQDLRIFLDEVSYNIVVDALCKQEKVDQAVALLDEMKGKQMDMDIMHYTTLINGRGLANEALKLYDYMKSQDLKPTAITHNVMIEGLCIGGKVTEAEEFFCNIEDKSLNNYGAMITGYCEAKHTEKASELFFELSKKGLLMDRGYIYKLLEKLCEEGEKDRALWLLRTMLDLNMEPSKDIYGKVITACYRAGDMRSAETVFGILHRIACRKPTIFSRDMKHRGIKPDLVTFTVLLDGHLKRAHSEAFARKSKEVKLAASSIWKEMQNTEIRPDVICYTALIDGHCKVDRLEDAIGLYDEMIYRGVEPDIATCTALLSGCRNRRDVDMFLK